MTLLVAWTGIDSRSPASVYIATDSRVSWGDQDFFDHSNKTFALRQFPAILGYCGDSLASQMLISQAMAVIEAMPDYAGKNLENLVDLFIRLIVRNYTQYPVKFSTGNFTVVMCGKATIESAGDFECFRIDSTFKDTTKSKLLLPNKSGPIVVAGSGRIDFEEQYKIHQSSENPNKSTSRDVFHAFYQSINKGGNPTVGPAPQIVSVIRKPNSGGAHCGVVVKDQRYISGQLVDKDIVPEGLQWFNDNFEITNPHTKRREDGAQVQPPFHC
ncbi:MAG: hypothetical protein KDI76_06100 [Xanthomonadales bacterium]|nr:hypothetical protein [Xanthomonadales bacterium]